MPSHVMCASVKKQKGHCIRLNARRKDKGCQKSKQQLKQSMPGLMPSLPFANKRFHVGQSGHSLRLANVGAHAKRS
jgi:hypothetical protein